MITQTHSGPLGELRLAGASKGVALTTAAAFTAIPRGTKHVFLTPRNFSTAVVARIAINPYLVVLKTTDSLVNVRDFSEVAQDGDAATEVVLDAMSTAANGDYLYVGSHVQFRGVYVAVSADDNEANGNASTLTVNYWNGVSWTDISDTDNTVSSTISLAVNGTVTWTVPSDWKKASLVEINSPIPGSGLPLNTYKNEKLYWTRWQWSAALDALVRLDAMLAMNRSTAYWEMIANQTLEMKVERGYGGIGCVEALTDDGTGNLLVNVASYHDALFG